MKTTFLTIGKFALTLVLAVLIAVLLFVGAAKIPQDAIQGKMEESAVWMNEREQIEYLIPGVAGTQLHYSADATWLSITYDLDNSNPLTSAMWSCFSTWQGTDYNGAFYQSVMTRTPGEQQYLRYWHGPTVILRVLHLFLNIHQIYTCLSIVVAALMAVLVIMLCRRKYYSAAVSFMISMVMVGIWMVPLCLEYVWMFLVMLVASILAVKAVHKNKTDSFIWGFFVIGITAAFLDFLTTETITLLIPLLLILYVSRRCGPLSLQGKKAWIYSAKSCFSWLAGFLGMWAMKWVVASVVLGENVMPYVREHIAERLGKSVGLTLPDFLRQAVTRNVGRLFIFDYGMLGAGFLLALIAVFIVCPIVMNRVTLRKQVDRMQILLYALLGVVPYIRYLVLHNHSYGHYCFTYRAQAATVMALCFILLEFVEPVSKKKISGG